MTKTIEAPERGIILPPEIDDATRREFLIGAAGLLVLGAAGCGGQGDEDGQGASGDTRTVRHALGETEVPARPQRVVTLFPGGVDLLLMLGVAPIACQATPGEPTGAPAWFDEVDWPVEVEARDIENVATGDGVNIERVAVLEPDLIVGWDYHFEGVYEELSQIAPSVGITPNNGPEWKEAFGNLAAALGKEREWQEYLDSYDGKLEELRASMSGDPADYTVSMLNAADLSFGLTLYGAGTQPGSIVKESGFGFPEIGRSEDEDDAYPTISLEKIPDIDADAIFLMTNLFEPSQRKEFDAKFAENPLWGRLEAVEKSHVYPVENLLWTNGGPTANRDLMLPQLFAAFEDRSG